MRRGADNEKYEQELAGEEEAQEEAEEELDE